jgi:hypothetical protein
MLKSYFKPSSLLISNTNRKGKLNISNGWCDGDVLMYIIFKMNIVLQKKKKQMSCLKSYALKKILF